MGDNDMKIKLLCDDYGKIAMEVTSLGFMGDMPDLEVEVAHPQTVIDVKEKFIHQILDTNALPSTGRFLNLEFSSK